MLISLIMVNIHSVFGCQKVKLYILNMYNFYLSIISYKAGKNPKFHDFFNTSALFFIFFNDTATTEIYTLSLHDALPIWSHRNEKPVHRNKEQPLLATTRESPHVAMKTQRS